MEKSSDEIQALVNSAIDRFYGPGDELVGAVGMLLVGQVYGWRVMRLITSRKMWKRYREIFDVPDLKDLMLERGALAGRSRGLRIADELERYWDLVKGLCGVSMEQKGIIERR